MARTLGTFTLTLALCAVPLSQAHALDTTEAVEAIEVGFDAVIIRPLRLFSLMLGGLFLVPSLGMSSLNGKTSREEAIETFWTIPYENLVERKLGDL